MFRSSILLLAVGLVAAKDLSQYREDGYFGTQEVKNGQIPTDNQEVRPFNISIPDSDLAYLKKRLANSRYIDHLPDTEFFYGTSSDELKSVVKYWNSTYDWRKQEAYLNSYPNFKTQIEGIDIHFVHVKASPKAKIVVPLLTCHGWPSSFYEAYEAMPLYTEPDEHGIAFEVIAPSIPGYGYSESAHLKGMDNAAAARIFHKLMTQRLGFQKYFLQGGDWGGIITRAQAILYPDEVIGIHVLGLFDVLENLLDMKRLARNVLTPHLPSLNPAQWKKDYEKLFPLKETLKNAFEESAILHYQMTKPDTIATALQDSPVGLAAHILDKFCTFVNLDYLKREDGGLTQKFTLDQLLTNIMIYWTSGNLAGTTRIYKEFVQLSNGINNEVIKVPAGVVDAPHEATRSPRFLVEGNYANLVQYTDLERGGHLMAFEEPKLVVEDLRKLVPKVLDQNKSLLEKLKNRIEDAVDKVKDGVEGAADKLKDGVKDTADKAKDAADKVKEGLDKLNPFRG